MQSIGLQGRDRREGREGRERREGRVERGGRGGRGGKGASIKWEHTGGIIIQKTWGLGKRTIGD